MPRVRTSLASLSALEVPPPRFVEYAADAGFDAVGLRIAADEHDRGFMLADGGPLARDTRTALDDHGLAVLDVEVVKIHPTSSPGDWLPVLDAGVLFGAQFVLTTVLDDEPGRADDNVAALSELARERGLRCCVEPMIFSAIADLHAGRDLLRRSAPDARLLLDVLHWERAGGDLAELAGFAADIPYCQVCDADTAGRAASENAAITEARRNRLAPGEGVLAVAEVITALGEVPLSVEAPSDRAATDPRGWIRHLGEATRRLLQTIDAPSSTVKVAP